MADTLAHERLRVKGNAHSRHAQHGEVVRAIANRHYLVERDILLLCDGAEEFSFLFAIDNFACDSPGDRSVFYLQFVRKNVIEPQPFSQVTPKEGEAPGQDRGLIAKGFQCGDESLRAFFEWN